MRIALVLIFTSFLSAQDKPIPDSAILIREVTAHQREMETVRENYTCHQITELKVLDRKGEVKSTTSEEHEVFFANHHRIARLVKKNDVELNAVDQKCEQNRIMKQVEHDMKTPATGFGVRGSLLRVSEVLAVAKMSEARRVTLNDRDTLVFDFVGDPAAEAHGLNQDAGRKLAGTLWVDEADRQVANIEVTFYENFAIGGGVLARIQKGTKMNVLQAPVGDGLWMPSVTDQHIAARVLLLHHIRRDIHQREFDFHKFDVDSLQQIKPPVQ